MESAVKVQLEGRGWVLFHHCPCDYIDLPVSFPTSQPQSTRKIKASLKICYLQKMKISKDSTEANFTSLQTFCRGAKINKNYK